MFSTLVALIQLATVSTPALAAADLVCDTTPECAAPDANAPDLVAQAGPVIQLSTPVAGELGSDDATLQSGEWIDYFVVPCTAGDQIVVSVESTEVDTYVLVRSPNGFAEENDDVVPGSNTNSRLAFIAPDSGEYIVGVTSYSAGETGRYTVTVSPSSQDLLAEMRGGGDARPLALGSPADGALDGGDAVLSSGEFVEYWRFDGAAGTTVRITMRSGEFDTYIGLTGPGDFHQHNDDAPGLGTNSRLVTRLPADGTYTIQATSYAAGEQGAYALSLDPDGPSTNTAVAGSTLASGAETDGQLDSSDAALGTGEFFEVHQYAGHAGERLRLSLRSDAFDTYLMLRGPNTSHDNDNAGDGSTNSLIEATIPEDGAYRVVVTSYAAGETGSYSLDVESSGSIGNRGGTLTAGVPGSGTLSGDDPVRAGGQHYQRWTFAGSAGQSVTIDLSSRDFDTFLALRGPDGQEQTNDDIDRRDTDSRINAVLASNGTYEVVATSYLSGAVGDYQVALSAADVEAVIGEVGAEEIEAGSLTWNAPVAGRLARRDEQLRSGEYYDTFTFAGRAGQGLTLAMESSAFDTYVMLRGPGELSVDNDDGFSSGTNSRLEATLPVDGTYSVLATSYSPGERGRYTVTLSEGTTVQQNARGEVFAILAGITDYNDASDLPFCAEDAVKLGETLGETGILDTNSIVLTDGEVTRANLERAFQTAAANVGPDDVFLFFYSGHGATLESRDELDGRNETLYVVDGHITDDEVDRWFDGISARVGVIALDSCFSGGFARDVISSPDRLGIFSSEEDVTSNVASRFQAGGYLSYFLRTGLAGDADTDPTDGIITAGELTQYLRRQWATTGMVDVTTETTDAAVAYQNLVIDRGSVKVTDVILHSAAR